MSLGRGPVWLGNSGKKAAHRDKSFPHGVGCKAKFFKGHGAQEWEASGGTGEKHRYHLFPVELYGQLVG